MIYDSRSGSTFLSSRLDQFEDIDVTVETSFLQSLVRLDEDMLSDPHAVLNYIVSNDPRAAHIVKYPNIFFESYHNIRNKTHYNLAKCILNSYHKKPSPAKIWIVKGGRDGWHIKDIKSKMPDMIFLHLLRDGRGVLNSKLNTKTVYRKGTMSSDVITPAIKWRSWIKHIDSFMTDFPEKCFELKFENLILHERSEISRLRSFLGLSEYDKTKKGDQITYLSKIPEIERSLHSNVGNEPRERYLDKWVTNLNKGDIILFEYLAFKALVGKGYSPLFLQSDRLPWSNMLFWHSLIKSVLRFSKRKIASKSSRTMRKLVHSKVY